ncbi:hypothetical protein AAW14_01765 [Streptomyces hygroscopicus]|uniref:hypothetical protein n=1 Tax=Streptomyces hygroscopicus TaxID=1912 RepID=UPI00223EA814|nr:hypothetical protein [Streptomyces hygroscopicus]MCW7940770.1 hypothetical protein [Streptomyces hygroscopicus]
MNSPVAHAPQVEVVVSDCSPQDAGSLFAELCRHFASDRRAEDTPHETQGARPTMWIGTFDTSAAPASSGRAAGPSHLSGPVKAELQGEPRAVERLRRALDETFDVRQLGVVAGDQEVDIELRLESRDQG